MKKIYIVAGGDRRFAAAAEYLAEKGHDVRTLAGCCDDARTAEDIPPADCLILPVPVTADGENLFASEKHGKIPLESLPALLKPGGAVFGGRVSEKTAEIFGRNGFVITDYTKDEEFAVRNAAATAEGALAAAMTAQDITLFRQNILVIGLGRIGKSLVRILSGFGAHTAAAVRSPQNLVWAEILGCRGFPIENLPDEISRFTLIFNTAPAAVLTRDVLYKAHKDVLIIDLASAPGGTDLAAAKELSLNAFGYNGIPGRTSPVSAGMTAAEVIENILQRNKKEEKN